MHTPYLQKQFHEMKKSFLLILSGCMATLIACGPSAEEKAAAEKARQDSINAVQAKITEDSIQAAMAIMEKHRQDSIAMAAAADSIAKAQAKKGGTAKPKPKPKTREEEKLEEAKKATRGRG